MRTLKERIELKKAEKEREEKKLSGRVINATIHVPVANYPPIYKQSDKDYLKNRAKKLVETIRHRCSWQFYEEVKKAIKESEKVEFTVNWDDITPTPREPQHEHRITPGVWATTRILENGEVIHERFGFNYENTHTDGIPNADANDRLVVDATVADTAQNNAAQPTI